MNSSCAVNPANNQTARGLKILAPFAAAFVLIFFLPIGTPRFDGALREGFGLTKWYAQEHVLLCLIPALLSAVGMELRAQPAVAAFDRHFHGYYAGTFHPAILAQGTGKTASEISPRGLACKHPEDIGGMWQDYKCSFCLDGGLAE